MKSLLVAIAFIGFSSAAFAQVDGKPSKGTVKPKTETVKPRGEAKPQPVGGSAETQPVKPVEGVKPAGEHHENEAEHGEGHGEHHGKGHDEKGDHHGKGGEHHEQGKPQSNHPKGLENAEVKSKGNVQAKGQSKGKPKAK